MVGTPGRAEGRHGVQHPRPWHDAIDANIAGWRSHSRTPCRPLPAHAGRLMVRILSVLRGQRIHDRIGLDAGQGKDPGRHHGRSGLGQWRHRRSWLGPCWQMECIWYPVAMIRKRGWPKAYTIRLPCGRQIGMLAHAKLNRHNHRQLMARYRVRQPRHRHCALHQRGRLLVEQPVARALFQPGSRALDPYG